MPLAPCITSLPLSPLLALPFLQHCYLHGPQPSGPPQHFLGADQGSSRCPPPFHWMLSPHRGCGSLNRLSCLNDPTDLNSFPGFVQASCIRPVAAGCRCCGRPPVCASIAKAAEIRMEPSASQVRNLDAPGALSRACRYFSVNLCQ